MSDKKPPVSSAVLINKKAEATARLDELRRQQADAFDLGEDFQHDNETLLISERIAALDMAIGRAQKREAVEAERLGRAQERDRLIGIKDDWLKTQAEYLDLFADAEEALAKVAALFADIDQKAADLYRQGLVIKGILSARNMQGDEPNEFHTPNVHMRLGGYASSVLYASREGNNRTSIGGLHWDGVRPLSGSWISEETTAISGSSMSRVSRLDRIINDLREPDPAPVTYPYEPGRVERVMAALQKPADEKA